MRTEELDYELPPERIATHPAEPRDAARLMVVHRDNGTIRHCRVRDLPTLGVVGAGDLMVVNQTRVLPAAFEGTRAATGGRVRGLYLASPSEGRWLMMLEARGTLEPGERVELDERATLVLEESLGRGQWRARCESAGEVEPAETVLSRVGHPPLPPYIQKARRARHEAAIQPEDPAQYNTVYARDAGSVAAPTAGLHFTPDLLTRLAAGNVQRAAVTLHVGLGTFAPVRSDDLADHAIHEEWLHVPGETVRALERTRAEGRRVLVVGTTTVRALESLPTAIGACRDEGYTTRTRLFIQPDVGFAFRFTDMLMTNFHLPRSTLMAMVAALPGVGLDRLKAWYREAIEQEYRFYSYGDAMLIV